RRASARLSSFCPASALPRAGHQRKINIRPPVTDLSGGLTNAVNGSLTFTFVNILLISGGSSRVAWIRKRSMSDITLSKAVRSNLLSLQGTADLMAKTQERLATGNKVNSALDNPSSFFTASALNSRAGDLNALMDNMANGIKTLEMADNGLSSITKTLESMQSSLRQARQDKSFQVDTYEVSKDSTLKVNGGRFAAETEIRLQEPTGGTKATLTSGTVDFNE